MLLAVKNNSDKTLDIEFNDKGVDKEGNEVSCESYGMNIQKAVGPGETRWFKQMIIVEGDDAANIDHMSGGAVTERFTATESQEHSFGDQVELFGVQDTGDGITGIQGTNNSEYTGDIEAYILYKKDGEPVYFTNVAICNLKDGEIVYLEPGQSSEDPIFAGNGGDDYDDFEIFVVAYTQSENPSEAE